MMSQESTATKGFRIGNYIIYPETKIIASGRMIGGIYWDGYAYYPDSTFNYDTTALILLGNIIELKERFKGIDFKTLKPLPEHDWYMDKNGIYNNNAYNNAPLSSLKGLHHIRGTIYEKEDGRICFIHPDGLQYWHSNIIPDILTLTHITDGFFMDKNGLYNVLTYNRGKTTETAIETYDGVMPGYKVYTSYITVGNKAFARIDAEIKELDLDISKIKEHMYPIYEEYYIITDSKKTYYYSKYYKNSDFQELEKLRGKDLGVEIKTPFYLSSNSKKNCLYFKDEYNAYGLLFFNSKTGVYTRLNRQHISTFKAMYINNIRTGKEEIFNYNKYKYLGQNLYVYDGVLCSHGGRPVKETFDVDKLHIIQNDKITSNFVTDGTLLLCNTETGSIRGSEYIYKEEYIANGVDFESLEIISPDLLIDKNNIYWGSGSLNVIPRKELGVKIEIYK